MHMRTPEEYKESLRGMRPNVYKFGELIEDVTTHPATRRTIDGHARIFKEQHEEGTMELLTKISTHSKERVSRYLALIRTPEDMIANVKMKRHMFNATGTCTGGRCVGYNCFNAMWSTTYDMDKEYGTEYHLRLKRWLDMAQRTDITIAGALTDPKGDRSKAPSAQEDPDMFLRVVETRDDGIVVRGAKVMICGVAAANEIFVLPGTGYKEPDAHHSISFAIPRDIENLTIIEARRPSDAREEGNCDCPSDSGGITQAYLLFDDVFIPNERVFMNGEYKYSLQAVMSFVASYRSAIGGCVAGQGDVMVGASILMARANGLNEKVFRDKLTQMMVNNETTFAMGVASSAMGKAHPSGVWIPDTLLANVNKVHVGTLPYETKRLAQDIAGGIAETGCIPSAADLDDPRYGDLLKKYLKAGTDGESRVKVARLIEWLTMGSGVPGCMHGGGSPDGAKLIVNMKSDTASYVEMAKRLIGQDE